MVTVKGSDAALDKIIAEIAELADKRFHEKVTKVLQEQAITLITEGFKKESDPYGSKWPPLKRVSKKRGGKEHLILTDTARLRRSFTRGPASEGGFQVGTNVEYAASHQYGRDNIPQRMMVPVAARGFGPIWGPRFARTARELMAKHFKKKE